MSPEPAVVARVNPVAGIRTHDLETRGIASHHAAHLALTRERKPFCLWFAGPKEGSPRVVLLRSGFDGEKWSRPVAVLSAPDVARLTHRYIRKIGNPVTWRDANGDLHLYVVTVTLGGWSGSRVAHLVSRDDGVSFTSGEMLGLSPLFNFSTLVKGSAINTATESLVPVYQEFLVKRPLLISLDAQGGVRTARRMGHATSALQPTLAPLPAGGFVSCLRNYDRSGLVTQRSPDGVAWSEIGATNLPNPNSAVAQATLPDGRPILAFNDSDTERHCLSFAIRETDAVWKRTVVRIADLAHEISYPTLLATPEGLHCVFTNNRTHVTHKLIPWEILMAASPAPEKKP